MAGPSQGWFPGRGRMKRKLGWSRWPSEVSGAVGINLHCWNLDVCSHSLCQHLNWLLTSQTCPKNYHRVWCPFCHYTFHLVTRRLLDPKETQGTALSFVPVLKANPKLVRRHRAPVLALILLISLSYLLRDVGNHHFARVVNREEMRTF